MKNKSLFIFSIIFFLSGCAAKSYNFVGVHSAGIVSVVAKTAVLPVDNFIREWLTDLERGDFEQCYSALSSQIQNELSLEKLKAIRDELAEKYGRTQKLEILELPITRAFPLVDEALFKKTTASALKYYDYVLARYLSSRPKHNLVYFIGVAMNNDKLEIVTFGMGEETFNPEEESNYLYWFGFPSF